MWAFGFRMLVDIASRSPSESFADPTIDRLHDCLRQLARQPSPWGEHRDEHGALRLIVRTTD